MRATLIMFTIWLAKIQATCPPSCNCTSTTIACTGMLTVPDLTDIETMPVAIDFSNSSLIYLEQDDFNFPHASAVIELYLNESGLNELGNNTFKYLKNLQTLQLSGNLLKQQSFDDKLVKDLQDLIVLDLSENYFNGDMPRIRSKSLEVLGLLNSDIETIPNDLYELLPNLKMLILKENNIRNISYKPFEKYNSIFIDLSYNPFECNCDNVKTLNWLAQRKFIDSSAAYKCRADETQWLNMLDQNILCPSENVNKIEYKSLDSLNEYNDDKERDIAIINKEMEDIRLSTNCLEPILNGEVEKYKTIFIATSIGFLFGFLIGAIVCKMLYTCRYRKLEQSDSQVQLLNV